VSLSQSSLSCHPKRRRLQFPILSRCLSTSQSTVGWRNAPYWIMETLQTALEENTVDYRRAGRRERDRAPRTSRPRIRALIPPILRPSASGLREFFGFEVDSLQRWPSMFKEPCVALVPFPLRQEVQFLAELSLFSSIVVMLTTIMLDPRLLMSSSTQVHLIFGWRPTNARHVLQGSVPSIRLPLRP